MPHLYWKHKSGQRNLYKHSGCRVAVCPGSRAFRDLGFRRRIRRGVFLEDDKCRVLCQQFDACLWSLLFLFTFETTDVSAPKKITPRSFGIIELDKKSGKIFEFKGLICKIFRNKDLAAPSYHLFGRRRRNAAVLSLQPPLRISMTNRKEKRCGSGPHPLRVYSFIISISTCCPDNFSNFIFADDSWA